MEEKMDPKLGCCIVPIYVSHEGCPFQCVFCNQKIITGQKEKVTPQAIEQQIEEYSRTLGPRELHLAYYGGSFTGISKERQIELLEPATRALDNKKIGSIRISTRPDYIDKERLSLLRRYKVS